MLGHSAEIWDTQAQVPAQIQKKKELELGCPRSQLNAPARFLSLQGCRFFLVAFERAWFPLNTALYLEIL